MGKLVSAASVSSSITFPTVAMLVLLVLSFAPLTVHAGPYTWNAVLTGAKIVHDA